MNNKLDDEDLLVNLIKSRITLLKHEHKFSRKLKKIKPPDTNTAYSQKKKWFDIATVYVEDFEHKTVDNVIKLLSKDYKVKLAIKKKWNFKSQVYYNERYIIIFHGKYAKDMRKQLNLKDLCFY
tara:strand:- start:3683 stop:4054 length:372 start_codon:yes stop_codon:yes gene_type:complete